MVNLPIGDQVAVRAVGYYTQYGGFIDALREGGGVDEDVNDGHRVGGRLAITLEPVPGIRLTPRVVYQEIRADGFNRQEVYSLFANPFTTTRPAVTFDERQQIPAAPGRLFGRHVARRFHGAGRPHRRAALTSISTYIDREIVVSRDASALTGSVSVDLGFPAAAVLLPSNLIDTTDLSTFAQEVRLSTDTEARSTSSPASSTPTPIASIASACPPRAMTPPPMLASAPASAAVANGVPPDRPTMRTCPTTSGRPRCSARRPTTSRTG